jgi:hypothetical protein
MHRITHEKNFDLKTIVQMRCSPKNAILSLPEYVVDRSVPQVSIRAICVVLGSSRFGAAIGKDSSGFETKERKNRILLPE